ncbi:FRG domain-containing protein [Flavobacterium sp. RS13.1]|uniref:FRG domain-containing protein n=1 Tax=Flavobacterium sp. RS13.1 TaxID=3400345 RepID=UPI003AAE6A0A
MQLPVYKTLQEKKEHFQIIQINTIDEFNLFFNSHRESKGIYRGISSATYKIYTSLQRQNILNNVDNFSISNYISRVRREPLIKKYFELFKIAPSKLSFWSYLQHYGAPTPYIDFTLDIKKALYFAIEDFDIAKYECKNDELLDRFSLFYLDKTNLDLISIDKVFESFKKYKQLSTEMFESYSEEGDDYDYDSLIEHFDKMFDINILEVFLIEHNENFLDIYNTYNNIRIVAQDGLFINNSYDLLPLEEALKKFFIIATQYQHSPWDELDTPQAREINDEYQENLEKNREFQKRLDKNIMVSYDIKKELIPQIKELINIDKKDIYPNQSELVWKIYKEVENKSINVTISTNSKSLFSLIQEKLLNLWQKIKL